MISTVYFLSTKPSLPQLRIAVQDPENPQITRGQHPSSWGPRDSALSVLQLWSPGHREVGRHIDAAPGNKEGLLRHIISFQPPRVLSAE